MHECNRSFDFDECKNCKFYEKCSDFYFDRCDAMDYAEMDEGDEE